MQSSGTFPYEHSSVSRNKIKEDDALQGDPHFSKSIQKDPETHRLPHQTELCEGPGQGSPLGLGLCTLHLALQGAARPRFARLSRQGWRGCAFLLQLSTLPPAASLGPTAVPGMLATANSRGGLGSGQRVRRAASRFPPARVPRDLLPGAAHSHHQQHRRRLHLPATGSPAPSSGTGPARPLTSQATPSPAPVQPAGWCSRSPAAGVCRSVCSATRDPPGTRGQR